MFTGQDNNELSQAQVLRCAAWGFGFSILCYVLMSLCTHRCMTSSSRWRPFLVWTSSTMGFVTGFLKEVLDGMSSVDELPWCGPNSSLENPCRFQGGLVLVYYGSTLGAMALLMAIAMTRARLRNLRLRRQPPPCDDTVAMSVDDLEDLDNLEEGRTDKAKDDDKNVESGPAPTEYTDSDGDMSQHSLAATSSQHSSTGEAAPVAVIVVMDDSMHGSPEAASEAPIPTSMDKLNKEASNVVEEQDNEQLDMDDCEQHHA